MELPFFLFACHENETTYTHESVTSNSASRTEKMCGHGESGNKWRSRALSRSGWCPHQETRAFSLPHVSWRPWVPHKLLKCWQSSIFYRTGWERQILFLPLTQPLVPLPEFTSGQLSQEPHGNPILAKPLWPLELHKGHVRQKAFLFNSLILQSINTIPDQLLIHSFT